MEHFGICHVDCSVIFKYSAVALAAMTQTISLEVENPRITRAQFILDYLKKKGILGAYVMELHYAWEALMRRLNRKPGSYASMRVEVNKLKQSGDIEQIPDNEIPEKDRKGKHHIPRSFYRIVRV